MATQSLNVTQAVNEAAFDNLFSDDPTSQPAYIAAGMVNSVVFSAVRIVELIPSGSCCIFGTFAPDKTKPNELLNAVVISPLGKELIFKNSLAALAFANRMNFGANPDYPIEYVRRVTTKAAGDPIATAKSEYGSMVKESRVAADAVIAINGKVASSKALGWDAAAADSPNFAAFSRYKQAQTAFVGWKAECDSGVSMYAAVLNGAGIALPVVA
jgi:hypothetical protein